MRKSRKNRSTNRLLRLGTKKPEWLQFGRKATDKNSAHQTFSVNDHWDYVQGNGAGDQRVKRDQPKRSHLARISVVYGLIFLSFSSLILRMAYLQMVKGTTFRSEASTTITNKIPVLPPRGRIFDSNGTLLAYDQPVYSLALVQSNTTNQIQLQSIAMTLAPVFRTTPQSIMNNIQSQKQYAMIMLFKNITEQQVSFVIEHQDELPGVTVELDSEREYPYGALAGHVLGYVGPITSGTANYYVNQLHYLPDEQVGETGIESEYNQLLQGKVGQQLLTLGSAGLPLSKNGLQSGNGSSLTQAASGIQSAIMNPAPVAGDNLELTIDGHLQAVTQEDITNFVNHSPYKSTINDAAAVMLNVNTGAVLSLVSYPYYNPNWYTMPGQLTKHATYLATSGAQENNAIQNPNYPGSTVKPANMLTALKYSVITPQTAYYVPYQIQIAGAIKHDDVPHGFVDDAKAITVSSDVFFYNVGLWLSKWMGASPSSGGAPLGGVSLQHWRNVDFAKGITELFNGEWMFGLGQLTGIDLPGEQTGNFYIMDSHKQYAAVPFPLQQATKSVQKTGSYVNYSTPVSIALSAIGQEQQFTPVELAQYVATIANGGTRIQPHLLQAVYPPGLTDSLSTQQEPIQQVKPNVQANLKLNQTDLQIVHQGMYGVCNNPLGTAYSDFLGTPYKAAGKTGTADIYINGVHMANSVFIAYAPFNHPQVAVAIMIPGGGYGAQSAAAIARNMLDTYFKEHHEFFPKSQWESTTIPGSWLTSTANTSFTAK
ncbi:peptidoglycan D,D-transpeptidase FtsI family protein [Alicyclobacillus mengziensis]|uniref:Peptidoglycan glycosyltransferase n=1 Tax=Alicyclobacillus mengziensis TaxID=2931921 RepID=A0A9X7VYV0_9BACL|nr:penicillin-binding transpeptidase domain-containing protein [Alicyclobacillus mengziensis]QSO47085.1 peptidoglycan glycosyltransferase [Alicyclobacillus mengziensis]